MKKIKHKYLKFLAKLRMKRKPFTVEQKIRYLQYKLDIVFTVMTSSCGGGFIGSTFGDKGVIPGAIIATCIGLYFRYKERKDTRKQIQELKSIKK